MIIAIIFLLISLAGLFLINRRNNRVYHITMKIIEEDPNWLLTLKSMPSYNELVFKVWIPLSKYDIKTNVKKD